MTQAKRREVSIVLMGITPSPGGKSAAAGLSLTIRWLRDGPTAISRNFSL
jgi:hypothetical protein